MAQVLRPWLERFKPSLMLVSAGFDGHWSDPLTSLGLSTGGYFRLAQRLLALADEFCHGRAVFVLEGGYDPQRLADNVAAALHAMAGADTAPIRPARRRMPSRTSVSGWRICGNYTACEIKP